MEIKIFDNDKVAVFLQLLNNSVHPRHILVDLPVNQRNQKRLPDLLNTFDDLVVVVNICLLYTSIPKQIQDFDPAEAGGEQYLTGDYHGYYSDEVLTMIVPVTEGFSTKGYLLVHKPLSYFEEQQHSIMVCVYITLIVIYVLSFMIFLGIHLFIYLPLRKITEAAKQYASGNLDYEIPVNSQDEIGYLSASLNYMSTHSVSYTHLDVYKRQGITIVLF